MKSPFTVLRELVFLRRQTRAAERSAAALEQIAYLLSKATGIAPGSFTTFYADRKGSPEPSYFRSNDEELWAFEQEEERLREQGAARRDAE